MVTLTLAADELPAGAVVVAGLGVLWLLLHITSAWLAGGRRQMVAALELVDRYDGVPIPLEPPHDLEHADPEPWPTCSCCDRPVWPA